MKNTFKLAGGLALAALVVLHGPAAAQRSGATKLRKATRPIPNQYVVVLSDDLLEHEIAAVAADLVRLHGGKIKHLYKHAIKGFSISLSDADAAAISQDPLVKYVESDSEVLAFGAQNFPPWGLDRIDQRNLPLDSLYANSATGFVVNVYVIDTGVRPTHAEFQGRASIAADHVDDDGDNDPNDIGNDDGDPTQPDGIDCHGHGTHVAGTIAGKTYGVAKQANIWSHRVLGCNGSGTVSGVIAGIDAVTANHVKPAVANMSLGGPASDAIDEAVNASIAAGITYVVAAGNSNVDAVTTSPARVADALTVGATTSADERASFSNYGAVLDLFAPGAKVLSAWLTSDTATATLSGTSMAAPHVTGVVALYLEGNPTATPSAVAQAITSNATAGVVISPGPNSPNLLLYSGFVELGITAAVTVTAANGGEKLFIDSPFLVEWTATHVAPIESFDVFVSLDGGVTFNPVPGCTGLSGALRSCSWASPSTATSKGRFRIVGRDENGNAGIDESDGSFSLVSGVPTVTVKVPNTNVNWGIGCLQSITWSHNLGTASFVRLELSRDSGVTWELIASSVKNSGSSSGSFNWLSTGPATTRTRIRASWNNGPATDISNVDFTLAAPFVKVTAPNTAVNWGVGSNQQITWSHNLGTNEKVGIDISRDGSLSWSSVVASVKNSGSSSAQLNWVVAGPTTTTARIRVRWTVDPSVGDASDQNFEIAPPFISVAAPAAGVNWGYATSQSQTWSTNLGPGDVVDVFLSLDGGVTFPTKLGGPVNAKKSVLLTTPTLESPVTTARLGVEWTKDRTIRGMNPGNFRIEPPFVTVTAPNGPTHPWTVGKKHTITWANNLGSSERADILLSLDGGATYPILLVSNTPSDGTQSVTVQSAWRTNDGRVRVVWRKNAQVADASDQSFPIQ